MCHRSYPSVSIPSYARSISVHGQMWKQQVRLIGISLNPFVCQVNFRQSKIRLCRLDIVSLVSIPSYARSISVQNDSVHFRSPGFKVSIPSYARSISVNIQP